MKKFLLVLFTGIVLAIQIYSIVTHVIDVRNNTLGCDKVTIVYTE